MDGIEVSMEELVWMEWRWWLGRQLEALILELWRECEGSVERNTHMIQSQTVDVPAKGSVMSSFSREAAHMAPSVTSSFSKNSRHYRHTRDM